MKKLLNLDYALIQAIYWMLYAAAGIFVSVFLLDKGYSNTSIGTIIAVGSLLAILLQTIIANITDSIEKITNITMIKILLIVLFVLVVAALVIGEKSAALTIAYVGIIVVHTAMHPFVNALSFTLEETGHTVSYGLGRSMGSLAAGVICFLLGYLVAWFNPDVILYVAIINLILMTIVVFATDRHYKKGISNVSITEEAASSASGREFVDVIEDEHTVSMKEFITRNKLFVIMSIGIVGLFFGNVILENFTVQIVEGIGGDTEQMGFVIFLLSIFEMPAMLGFSRLKKHFSYEFLLRVAAVFFTIKITLMYLADSMTMIYLAQLCQILGYGLLFPALVSFIDHIMQKYEAVRGQAIFTISLTVGNVLGSVLGGMILDMYSSKTLLLISSAVSLAGTLIIVTLVGHIKKTSR